MKKCVWVKSWVARKHLGMADNFMRELAIEDPDGYRCWLRINVDTFGKLVQKLTPLVERQDTLMRKAVPVETKLAITLRLARGETYDSLHRQFRLGKNTVSLLVPEVCQAIYNILKTDFVKVPSSESEWCHITQQFWKMWQFPNCIGALDGKHVIIEAPPKSGSYYFNYKGNFSIVLMALVDADYKFLYVDIGTNGCVSNGRVWGKCSMKEWLEKGSLNVPPPVNPPRSDEPLPYVMVGDQGFGLKTCLMHPFPDHNSVSSEKKILLHGAPTHQLPVLTEKTCSQEIFIQETGEIWEKQMVLCLFKRQEEDTKKMQRTLGDFLSYFNSEAGSVSWQFQNFMA